MAVSGRRLDPTLLVRLAVAVQLVVGLVGIAFWQWNRAQDPETPEPNLEIGLIASLPAGIDTAYPVALERARRWRDDARLLSASQQVDWPLGDGAPDPVTVIPSGGWLNYVFVSQWRHPLGTWETVSLSLTVERSGRAIILGEPLTWTDEPAISAPALANYPVSTTAAIVAAEAVAGTEFRRGCPTVRHTTRVGLLGGSSGPEWLVTYLDDRPGLTGEPNDLEIRIDVRSGQVLTVVDRSLPCDDAT